MEKNAKATMDKQEKGGANGPKTRETYGDLPDGGSQEQRWASGRMKESSKGGK